MIIAAHNEALGIRQKLKDTLTLKYPQQKLQVIVASDGSTDTTDEVVREFEASGVELVSIYPCQGKTHAQNVAVRHAKHEVIVFSDATTRYDPDALRYLVGNYSDPKVGAVSGRYEYYDPSHGSPTALGSITFWNYENWIKKHQSMVRTITGCCGCIYSIRRRLYTPLPSDVISDLVQPLEVLLQGFNIIFEDRALGWEETTVNSAEEFRMRVRVITRGMQGLLTVPSLLMPWKNPWIAMQLWSHKILRWMVPVFLICLFAGNILLAHSPIFRILLIAQILFYITAITTAALPAATRSRLKGLFVLPLYFCLVNAASFLSLIQVMRGRKFTVWQPIRR
ncbi:MAG: glycosyltransferase family 2 protein [Acidobacteriaceae bacterium]